MISLAERIDFREACFVVEMFVNIPVAGLPPAKVIAGKFERSMLIEDNQTIGSSLPGKLVAESKSIIKQAKDEGKGSPSALGFD